jgi:hypothetical protein
MIDQAEGMCRIMLARIRTAITAPAALTTSTATDGTRAANSS